MVTRWIPAHRADLGLHAGDLTAPTLTVTNRAWYLLHRFVTAAGGRSTDQMAGRDAYIPVALANHWGAILTSADLSDWLQIGRWNGHAVVAAGITHKDLASVYLDIHELTPLADTPLHYWLASIGMRLTTSPSGLVITATPLKEKNVTVNLSKGGKVDLTKEAGGRLSKVRVALGWDARPTDGPEYDLDASVVGCKTGPDNKPVSAGTDWFVFYRNPSAPGAAIVHQGDELTGDTQGDDEQILFDLDKIPADITELVIVVTIHEAKTRGGQNFGLVDNAYIRIIDETTGAVLARFDLSEDTDAGVNCLRFGKLYRKDAAWIFRAIGDGFTDELQGVVDMYKIG